MADAVQRSNVLPFPSTLRQGPTRPLPFELPGEVVPLPLAAPPVKPPRRNEADAVAEILAAVFVSVQGATADMDAERAEAFRGYVLRAIPAARTLALQNG